MTTLPLSPLTNAELIVRFDEATSARNATQRRMEHLATWLADRLVDGGDPTEFSQGHYRDARQQFRDADAAYQPFAEAVRARFGQVAS